MKCTFHLQPEEVSDAVVEDPSVVMEARLYHNKIVQLLQSRTSRQTLLSMHRAQNMEYWSSLKLQGQQCHHQWGVPYFLYKGMSAGSSYKVQPFTVVSLQCIHSPLCMLHSLLNTCSQDDSIARHDRLVDLIAAQIPCVADEKFFKHTTVQYKWFNSSAKTFLGIPNTPDFQEQLGYLRCRAHLTCLWRTLRL